MVVGEGREEVQNWRDYNGEDIDRRQIENSIKMTSEHLTTPVSDIRTSTAATRRSSRLVLDSRVRRTEYEKSCDAQKTTKEKRRRISNIRRGGEAVIRRLESEEKADKSGEKVKTYEECCQDAGYLTDFPRQDLSKLINAQKRKRAMTDSAMNLPHVMSEDEEEADSDEKERRARPSEDLEYDEQYWFDYFSSCTARSEVSGRPRREGTKEEKEAEAKFKSTHPVKDLFTTFDKYATTFAEATLEISKTPEGKKGEKAREIVRVKFTDGSGNAKVTPEHLVAMARKKPGVKPRRQGNTILTPEEENAVAEFVKTCRAKSLPISPDCVRTLLNQQLESSPDPTRRALYQVLVTKNKSSIDGITKGILEGFYRRQGLLVKNTESLDVLRANWTTSGNGAYLFFKLSFKF